MSKFLIEAEDVCLDVPVYQPAMRKLLSEPTRFLSDLYLSRSRRKAIRLLDSISFTLSPGERIGLIGSNGAGKSTLLRVLGGVYPSSGGKLAVNGTAKGLFNIQLGMNAEGTGLENIYLRGLQMGMSLNDVREIVEGVVEFSELGDDIALPVSTYSTGMLLRLAFAISTMIEPDILLLDEWIGAGDARFKQKAQDRMNQLVDKSRGLVLATHNPRLMKKLCSRGLVLSAGKIVFDGPVEAATEYYDENIVANKTRISVVKNVQGKTA